jgi:5-methylcytosine-specific restriction endonuclease McrA
MIKTKGKKTDRQKQEALLDELYREYIRKRAMQRVGGCERCHTPKKSYLELQTAHFHSRNGHTTRWDIRNSIGSCGGCHMYLDNHEEEKIELEKHILGEEEYESLYILANLTTKQAPVDLKLKDIELRELLKEG